VSDNSLKIGQAITLMPQASAPSSPHNGEIYYDSTLGKFQTLPIFVSCLLAQR